MSSHLSYRVLAAQEAQTLAISNKAKKLKKQGLDIVSLSVGEPDFDTPECAKQAALHAIAQNFTHYTESDGIIELREAVANKFINDNDIKSVSQSTILISGGAKQCIYNVLNAICNEGDEVLIFAPYWVSYPAMVALTGATPIIIQASFEQVYKVTPLQLQAHLTINTKCVILNSPSNPTGIMYTEQEIRDLAAVLQDHDCYIISDEIYEKISFGEIKHFSPGAIESIAHRVITVNGVSKAYAMTGWRIGYMNAPEHVFKEASKVQGQSTSHPCSIAQKAALGALIGGDHDVENMRKAFSLRKQLVCDLLSTIPGIRFHIPDGAFYVFIELGSILADAGINDDAMFCSYLLDRFLLALVPGSAFGNPNSIRISFAASEQTLQKGILRLAEGISSLQNQKNVNKLEVKFIEKDLKVLINKSLFVL